METLKIIISQPWPWYVTGLLIALIMAGMTWLGRTFGVSSTLRTLCAVGGAGRLAGFFRYDWRQDRWNLLFIAGALAGGALAQYVFPSPEPIDLARSSVRELKQLGVSVDLEHLAPSSLFHWQQLFSWQGILLMVGGGFCIGFGTRYAGGCTSGHAITGLSHLQWPSLIAVIGFFLGGLISTHFLLPLLL